jgi:hypothetical protein
MGSGSRALRREARDMPPQPQSQQQQQQQQRGRLLHEVLTVLGVGAAIVLLITAIAALVFFLSGDTSGLHLLANLVGIALLVAFGAVLATLGQTLVQGLAYGRAQARAQARAARLRLVQEKREALAATSPEVALVLEMLQQLEEDQQAEAGRQLFWRGVAQSFVFYLVGVITPVLLLQLHLGS